MVGAGHQSAFQLRAAARQRAFERVVGWNLHPEMLPRLAETAAELGLPFEAVDLDRLGAEADVIITITSSFAPILMRAQVKPGTHLACMGTDTKGKQEVEAALVAAATVFTDEVAQSIIIGEAQHAVAAGPDRRGRHHPDRRGHQRRPTPAAARTRRSPSSTAPASACRTSPSPPPSSASRRRRRHRPDDRDRSVSG